MTSTEDREEEESVPEVESTLPVKRSEPEEESKEIPYKNTLNYYYREETQKSLDSFVTRTKRNDEETDSPKKQRTDADGGKNPSKTPSEDRVSPLKQKRVDEFVNTQRDKASILLSSE